MRVSAGLSDAAVRVAPSQKKGIFAKMSEYARHVAGILGVAIWVGVPNPAPAITSPSLSSVPAAVRPNSPSVPVPTVPASAPSAELRDREWVTVSQKGIGASDFAMKAFWTDDWEMLVDEDGNRLTDPSKLRYGKKYLVAANAKDAGVVSAAIKNMGWLKIRAPKTVSAVRTNLSADDLVRNAEEHLGKPYSYGASGKKYIDCSQLVVESLKTAGVVGEGFDTTAAGFYEMSTQKKLKETKKGDLVFLKNGKSIGHVAIALSAPDEKGYIEIIDASSSQGAVTKRKFHTSMAGLSVGSLPFVGSKSAPSPLPVYAEKKETAPAVAATPAAAPAPAVVLAQKAAEPVVQKVAPVAPQVLARTETVAEKPAVPAVRETRRTEAIAKTAPAAKNVVELRPAAKPAQAKTAQPKPAVEKVAKVAFESAVIYDFPDQVPETPVVAKVKTAIQKTASAKDVSSVESRVTAKVVSITAARIANSETAASIRSSLEKHGIDEQIDYFRAQSEASNDPSFALTATKLEIVKLHGERKLVSDNISHYKAQAARSVPGAFETVAKLNKVANMLDSKIQTLKMAVNDAEFQARKAA